MRTGLVIVNSFFRSTTSGHASLNKHQRSPIKPHSGKKGISETRAPGPQPLVGCSPGFTPGLLSTCFSCQGNCSLHSSSSLTANRQKLTRVNNRSVVLSWLNRQVLGISLMGRCKVALSPSSQFLASLQSSCSEQNQRTLPSLLQNSLACLIVPGNYRARNQPGLSHSSTTPSTYSMYPQTILLLTIKSRGCYADLLLSPTLRFSLMLKKVYRNCVALFFR